MFCTECGTQIDQGKRFCRNCGARLEGVETLPPASGGDAPRAQAISSESPPGSGRNKRLLVLAAGIAVLLLGGAGIYLGTGLFRPTTAEVPATATEPLAKGPETPALPSFEETKGATGASATSPTPAQSPPPVERPKLPLETLPESSPRPDSEPSSARRDRPAPAKPASRAGAASGIYETTRPTTVYEDPSASSKVLASIPAGTQVTVVGSTGDWLEVHSRRGNPPGFIRRGDASFVEKSN